MKAVILAGGRGTRIAEESVARPKPMITIGDRPILWHVMTIYAAHGVTDFIVCLGYKGYMIKEYFANYHLHGATSVTFDLANNRSEISLGPSEPWTVTLVETGTETMTGGRVKRIAPLVRDDEAFCMTYGDGLANVNVTALIAHHRKCGRHATMTTVSPPGRFGAVELRDGHVAGFVEKPATGEHVVNGGFFVLSPKVFDYIAGDETSWELEPLRTLAAEGQLNAFPHEGFWQPMDTVREREILENLWATGERPWLARSS